MSVSLQFRPLVVEPLTATNTMTKLALLCISVLVIGSQANVVPFLNPCHQTDSECIVKSAKTVIASIVNGYEPLGIPSIDPLLVEDLEIDGELKLKVKDHHVHNLSKCTINEITRDPAKLTIHLDAICPFHCIGNYEAKGKLLFIDIEGTGPYDVEGEKLHIDFTVKLEKTTRDGKEYYKIKRYDYTYKPMSKFVMKLGNLYNGDTARAEPINKIIEDNTNEIILSDSIGKPIVENVIRTIIKMINGIMKITPVDEIELA